MLLIQYLIYYTHTHTHTHIHTHTHTFRSDAASALASPELALSENMVLTCFTGTKVLASTATQVHILTPQGLLQVNMLLAAHQKGGGEGGAVAGQEREGEREREIESESAAPAELLVDYTQVLY